MTPDNQVHSNATASALEWLCCNYAQGCLFLGVFNTHQLDVNYKLIFFFLQLLILKDLRGSSWSSIDWSDLSLVIGVYKRKLVINQYSCTSMTKQKKTNKRKMFWVQINWAVLGSYSSEWLKSLLCMILEKGQQMHMPDLNHSFMLLTALQQIASPGRLDCCVQSWQLIVASCRGLRKQRAVWKGDLLIGERPSTLL